MSKLLLDEHPIMVMPQLAVKVGLNESMFLQQVHYWNEINKRSNNNYKDGYYWTFNSIEGWSEQFPFLGKRTIQRAISNLEKMKVLVTGNYNKLKIDRTKWYRIDYEVLEILDTSPFSQIDAKNMPQWLDHLDSLTRPLPETNPEINTETTPKRYLLTSKQDRVLNYYNECYKIKFNKDHPTLTEEQLEDMSYHMDRAMTELNMDEDAMMDAIEEHFNRLSSRNDGKVFSFLKTDGMTYGVIFRYVG